MRSKLEISEIVKKLHQLNNTEAAAYFVLNEYQIMHKNFAGFAYREKALPSNILFTADGDIGQPQIIRIPENTFEFTLDLMVNLFAHEMVHVMQKSAEQKIQDRNEREWQAYYEMCFHKIFPLVPKASNSAQKYFATRALEYYNRMEKEGDLQKKYAHQKIEIENFISSLTE